MNWPSLPTSALTWTNIAWRHVALLVHMSKSCNSLSFQYNLSNVSGNYYSLRGEHAKALMYFRKVLKLDSSYLSAWTLIGHEFMELKKPLVAIKAYRRALGINLFLTIILFPS
jgi:anaphase-promoting complex subunit 8